MLTARFLPAVTPGDSHGGLPAGEAQASPGAQFLLGGGGDRVDTTGHSHSDTSLYVS